MKTLIILCVIMLLVSGCGGMGGQGLYARASENATITINFYVTDGGTDVHGLWYKPKADVGGDVSVQPTTKPAE
ncbi:MAG: hypothetical protein GY807_24865 [Gammaproteobacteria bacterium]|nr:hypothetical protein [Gammaproteobacteria bacterium]